MRVVALISGGKDSCYNMVQCVQQGHEIVALANLKPRDDKDELDSYMYQTVGHQAIYLYSEAMGLPLYRRTIQGSSLEQGRNYKKNENDEVEDLFELLKDIQKEIPFDAVSTGAILSDYQRVRVEHVCSRLGISSLAFLWRREQNELLQEMIASSIDAIIIKVAALGLLPSKHLGMPISQIYPHMCNLHSKYGSNICGEGGEYETFTLDCPLFKKKIVIDESEVVIHSDDAFAPVGYLTFKTMHLEDKTEEPCVYSVTDKISSLSDDCDAEDVVNVEPSMTETECAVFQKPCHGVKVAVPAQHSSINYSLETRPKVNCEFLWVANITGHCGKEGERTIEDVANHVMGELTERVCRLEASPSDVVMTHLFIKNMANFAKVNSVYKKHFLATPPARACVQFDLPEDTVIQMDCLLYKPRNDIDVLEDSIIPHREVMHVQSISHWAPANIGPYSQANKVGKLMFVSGVIGLHSASMKLVEGGIKAQAALSLKHVHRVVSAFSPDTSLHNLVQGFCYVTERHHVMPAREGWQKALQLQDVSTDDVCQGLMSFIVVPALPKGALVEWQVMTHDTRTNNWKYNHSSVQRNGFQWTTESTLSSSDGCAAMNCYVGSGNSLDLNLKDILDCFTLEFNSIGMQDGDLGQAVITRIFYLKTIFDINTQSRHFIQEYLERIGLSVPFTLVPVEGLENGFIMLFSCWFQKKGCI